MREPNASVPHIGVVGGGVSGLATAYFLHQLCPRARLSVWESAARVGGALHTQWEGGYCVEGGADMFITTPPWALELCRRLGVELVGTDPHGGGAYVVHQGRLVPVPQGFAVMVPSRIGPLLRTPLLSWRGKLRLLAEPFIPPRFDLQDESMASFATRRLGREVFQRLVQPLVSGIYAADAQELSMQAALGRFVQMERTWGSLTAAWWHSGDRRRQEQHSRGARYGLFVAPRQGMSALVERLAQSLPAGTIHLECPVRRIRPEGASWQVQAGDNTVTVDALVLALPAWRAAELVQDWDAELSALLGQIHYGSAAVVCLALDWHALEPKPQGFGFVVPEVERRSILAASFSSLKFPHRAPPGGLLLRVFIGGRHLQHVLEQSDQQLVHTAWKEVQCLYRWQTRPQWARVFRWTKAMAHYRVGHVELVRQIRRRLVRWPSLALVGNAYDGVGVPYCVHGARQAAARLLDHLAKGHFPSAARG